METQFIIIYENIVLLVIFHVNYLSKRVFLQLHEE